MSANLENSAVAAGLEKVNSNPKERQCQRMFKLQHSCTHFTCYESNPQNFPQFVVIHTVKGFGVVNKAEVDVFLKLSCFYYDQWMFAILFLVLLLFVNPTCTSGSSQFTYCWSLTWRILSITFLACQMSAIVL